MGRGDGGTKVPVLGVVVSTQRRGAEVFATDLAAALEARGLGVRTVALAPGADGARLDLPTLGRSRSGPRALQALRAQSRRYEVVVAHGSHTLPACALSLIGGRTPFVYRNIGDP
ncbi:MAG: glycosyltransferase, partial [Acidimicrobiales bacterium]